MVTFKKILATMTVFIILFSSCGNVIEAAFNGTETQYKGGKVIEVTKDDGTKINVYEPDHDSPYLSDFLDKYRKEAKIGDKLRVNYMREAKKFNWLYCAELGKHDPVSGNGASKYTYYTVKKQVSIVGDTSTGEPVTQSIYDRSLKEVLRPWIAKLTNESDKAWYNARYAEGTGDHLSPTREWSTKTNSLLAYILCSENTHEASEEYELGYNPVQHALWKKFPTWMRRAGVNYLSLVYWDGGLPSNQYTDQDKFASQREEAERIINRGQDYTNYIDDMKSFNKEESSSIKFASKEEEKNANDDDNSYKEITDQSNKNKIVLVNRSNITKTESNGNYIIGPVNLDFVKHGVSGQLTDIAIYDKNGNKINTTIVTKNGQNETDKRATDIEPNTEFYLKASKADLDNLVENKTTEETKADGTNDIVHIKTLNLDIKVVQDRELKTVKIDFLQTMKEDADVNLNASKYDWQNFIATTPNPQDKKARATFPITFEERDVKNQVFDLALRKSITKINGQTPSTSRLPNVDASDLRNGATTAKYNHPKNALRTDTNQIVEFTLRVYNEGDRTGYAGKIVDHLPEGLEFVQLVNAEGKYTAEVSNDKRTVTITNTGKTKIPAYTGNGEVSYDEVKLECKVTKEREDNQVVLTNIAEITEYVDGTNVVAKDIDSEPNNFPKNEIKNSYNGNGKDGNYVPGQEDDDDFEKIVIPGREKEFDLALRKSITKINGQTPSVSRLPDVDASKLALGTVTDSKTDTTAKYNHPKNPLEVDTNQIVEFTLRVYNEGEKAGYAGKIVDHLPEGLEFVQLVNAEGKYTAEVSSDKRTVTITNIGKTQIPAYTGQGMPSYEEVKLECRVTKSREDSQVVLTNIAEIAEYVDGTEVVAKDIDSEPNNFPSNKITNDYNGNGKDGNYIPGIQDDDDFEKIVIPERIRNFDLALRKFITGVNETEVTDRIPQLSVGEDGNIKYVHTKTPIVVQKGNTVTYTLRIYNEGELSGYASEITDDVPEGLEYLPDNEINKEYRWKISEDGKKITTDYLSKEQEKTAGENLIKAYDKSQGITDSNPDYRDVKITFKVTEQAKSDRILINVAEISKDTDADGKEVDDIDSTPGNNKDGEDDIDREYVRLEYFDLALRKFITGVNETEVTDRIPQLSMGEDGNIKYNHTKTPVLVQNGDTVVYTLRIYNEGKISGYASEITDDVPEGLEYLPDNEINKEYRWKISEDGKKITTDYLSKEQEKEEGANLIKAYNKNQGITDSNPDYRDVKIAFKIVEEKTSDRILINTAEISKDTDADGKEVDDIDSTPGNNKDGEDDIDKEYVALQYFDLALRKFITGVNGTEVTDRIPQLSLNEDGTIKYEHTKEPVLVENGNIVTYTLRIYNEGKMAGYASEITDDVPEGLEYLPDNEINKEYRWKISEDGRKITTDYLSKEQEKEAGENLIKAYDKSQGIEDGNPDYRDVKIAFKVKEPNTSDRILVNTAEISKDTDAEGKEVDDIDSIPGNNNEWNKEDDLDKEFVKVKYFDLALKKWVSKTIIIENGKETVTPTGHTGEENPEPAVKVELHRKKLGNVTVKFGYMIKVTNEGEIEGYAKEITDYIPEGLKFEQEDNKMWTIEGTNKVTTRALEDTLLKPGESASVEIVLTWINSETNMGLKTNIAEISEDYNESDTPDIDSTPDNQVPGEDDIDDAPVLLSIETGQARIYYALTGIILITIAGGIILIKKYVL